jgi:hypothetical protein
MSADALSINFDIVLEDRFGQLAALGMERH